MTQYLGLGTPLEKGSRGPSAPRRILLRSASYDAATNTVTLIPTRPINPSGLWVTAAPAPAGGEGKAGRPSPPVQPLTDVAGNLINEDIAPGTFQAHLA